MQKLSLGVISSTDSWNWEDVNRKWFFENGIVREFHLEKMFVQQSRYGKNSVQNGSLKMELLGEFNLKNCLCNKAELLGEFHFEKMFVQQSHVMALRSMFAILFIGKSNAFLVYVLV